MHLGLALVDLIELACYIYCSRIVEPAMILQQRFRWQFEFIYAITIAIQLSAKGLN